MAAHSSVLAWEIPRREEPQKRSLADYSPWGRKRVRQGLATKQPLLECVLSERGERLFYSSWIHQYLEQEWT